MSNDRKVRSDSEETALTSSDLRYILEANQKAIEIYVEVEKQNDQILNILEYFKEVSAKVGEDLKLVKSSEEKIEELLVDDNTHDHGVIIDMLKTMSSDIKEMKDEIIEVKVGQSKIKESTDEIYKRIDEDIKNKISEIEKNLFKLVIILGSAGVGTIFTILQTFLHK